MSDNTPIVKEKSGILPTVVFWPLVVISAFMLSGAFILSYQLSHLPKNALIDCLRLIRATLFTYGLGLGLFGSAVALRAPISQRGYGTAVTLHGFGFLILAFAAKNFFDQRSMGFSQSVWPLVAPFAVLILSVILFLRTWAKHKAELEQEPPTEEPQSTLSQP